MYIHTANGRVKSHVFKTLALTLLVAGLSILYAIPASAASCAAQYTVRAGDTLYRIGLKYGLTWDKIAQANNITNPNRIFAGQVLCIPGTASTPAPTPRPPATPVFTVASVVHDQTVTIQARNFPVNQKFQVLMGAYGTLGVNGSLVGTTDSGDGSFTATYTIPAVLRGSSRIAIRLQGASGHFSYNWFWNNTAQ